MEPETDHRADRRFRSPWRRPDLRRIDTSRRNAAPLEEEGQAFDIVIGAKGNPLQQLLSTVYLLDAPTGNMDMEIYEALKTHEDVVAAFPIGMGDSYAGYRIVGTTRDLMDFSWGERMPYALSSGRYFEAPFEAVVGANVAQETGLKLGDTFVGTHGFVSSAAAEVHENLPYTVVGILERSGSPNDRGIFCDLQSVWSAHDHGPADAQEEEEHHHHEEITATLIKLASPALRFEFKDMVNRTYNAMAAIPIQEIQKLYEQLLGTAKLVLLAIGYLVVAISALSILIGLYMAILRANGTGHYACAGGDPGRNIRRGYYRSVLGKPAGHCSGLVPGVLSVPRSTPIWWPRSGSMCRPCVSARTWSPRIRPCC